jgi:light-regulated signal transduction histidine kinase (bacteriophytochrome)
MWPFGCPSVSPVAEDYGWKQGAAQAMNHDVLEFSNAIAGGTVWTQDAAARTTERIHRWFRRTAQGFLGAFMQLSDATEEVPPDSSNTASLSRADRQASSAAPPTLEEALCSLRDELTPGNLRARVFVTGKSKALKPYIQEQLYLIGREALVNALRHSEATRIEVEVEYQPRQLRMVLRDNGCGIDSQLVESGRNGHRGLLVMHERAASIGARLRIWSKLACGTEVEICVPGY